MSIDGDAFYLYKTSSPPYFKWKICLRSAHIGIAQYFFKLTEYSTRRFTPWRDSMFDVHYHSFFSDQNGRPLKACNFRRPTTALTPGNLTPET